MKHTSKNCDKCRGTGAVLILATLCVCACPAGLALVEDRRRRAIRIANNPGRIIKPVDSITKG